MARTIRTIEAVASSSGMEVDRKAGIIHGVKILGLVSDNNRKYMPEAVRKAKSLYEGIKVNIDHPAESGDVRSAEDRFGKLINVEYVEGEGLYGDLMFLKSHPMAERICEAAERNDMNDTFGLSHNAQGDGQEDDDGCFVVSSIVEVRHVDLVADPATTKSLRESRIKTMERNETSGKKMDLSQWKNLITTKYKKYGKIIFQGEGIGPTSTISAYSQKLGQDTLLGHYWRETGEGTWMENQVKESVYGDDEEDEEGKRYRSQYANKYSGKHVKKDELMRLVKDGRIEANSDIMPRRSVEFQDLRTKERFFVFVEGWKESDMPDDEDKEMTEATNFDDKQLDWIRKNVYDASKMGKVKTLAKTAQAAISEINKWLMGANQNHSGPKTAATFGHYRDALTSVPVNSTLSDLANLDPSKYINNDAFSESKSKMKEAEDMPDDEDEEMTEAEDMPVEDPSEEEEMTEEDDIPMEDPSEEEEMTEAISLADKYEARDFINQSSLALHKLMKMLKDVEADEDSAKVKQAIKTIGSTTDKIIKELSSLDAQFQAASGIKESEDKSEDDMPMDEAGNMPVDEADDEYTDDEDKMAMESKQYRKLQQFCKKNNVAFTKDLYKDLKPLTETAQQRCVLRIKLAAKARKPKSSGSIMPMTESKVHTGDNVFNWLRS